MRVILSFLLLISISCGKKTNPSRSTTVQAQAGEELTYDQVVAEVEGSRSILENVQVGQTYHESSNVTMEIDFPEQKLVCSIETLKRITVVEVNGDTIKKYFHTSETAANEECDPYTGPEQKYLKVESISESFDFSTDDPSQLIEARRINEAGRNAIYMKLKGSKDNEHFDVYMDLSLNFLISDYKIESYENGQVVLSIIKTPKANVDTSTLGWETLPIFTDEF